ncbi:transposase family protein [Streptomyces finlayi]|uniref:transposase family protein n=1 Tax=Streptomyces finlayi TaxID=67296 RepID=UPI0027E46921|nr:transposase family protein [Streptomyces finlayi]
MPSGARGPCVHAVEHTEPSHRSTVASCSGLDPGRRTWLCPCLPHGTAGPLTPRAWCLQPLGDRPGRHSHQRVGLCRRHECGCRHRSRRASDPRAKRRCACSRWASAGPTGRACGLADRAYQGAGATVRTPYYHHREQPDHYQQFNRDHARLRAPGERAFAQLKSWRLLRRARCSTRRISTIVQAIHTLLICNYSG